MVVCKRSEESGDLHRPARLGLFRSSFAERMVSEKKPARWKKLSNEPVEILIVGPAINIRGLF